MPTKESEISYTFIIPHKNIPSLLRRCLDSIPSRSDTEIIIIDDNSNADAIKELKKLSRKNLQIIYTSENKGAGFARNIGIANAHGKWVLFADADDFFLPNLIEKLDSYIDNPKPLVLFKSYCRNSDNLLQIGMRQFFCDSISESMDDFLHGKIEAHLLLLKSCVPWAKMIHLDYLQNNQLFFEEVKYSNDIEWITRLAIKIQKEDILISNDVIYCLTDRDKSLYHTRDKEAFYCRFDVRYRQHLLLQQNKIPSTFNIQGYINDAKARGLFFLITFYKHILQNNYHISPVYKQEKALHFRLPYFYLILQFIKCIKDTPHFLFQKKEKIYYN